MFKTCSGPHTGGNHGRHVRKSHGESEERSQRLPFADAHVHPPCGVEYWYPEEAPGQCSNEAGGQDPVSMDDMGFPLCRELQGTGKTGYHIDGHGEHWD